MFDISKRLLYYKRKDVQAAIVKASESREVGIRFGDKGYGKRPDIISYDNDILESVKNGATSFHVSEERWANPMQLTTEMRKEDLEDLRIGWDLVLDIDCPFWYYSKLTTYLFIKALKSHGIKSISCKFSGNKGFHIGVPFEAFPDEINNMPVKKWFPDGPKKIALYLLEYIAGNFVKVSDKGEINFDNLHRTTAAELSKLTGKSELDLSVRKCPDCHKKIDSRKITKFEFVCPSCSMQIKKDENIPFLVCPKCNVLMEKQQGQSYKCLFCNSKKEPEYVFDPLSIVEVDTILISSRHMYRSPYSMNEKSGLASVSIPVGKVLTFDKEMASLENVNVSSNLVFLDPSKATKGEALNLMVSAFDFGKENIQAKDIIEDDQKKNKSKTRFEDIGTAIPVELFPPCILKILEGLTDGKKRSMFILTNFLTSVNWDHQKAEELLLEWNKKNNPSLRDGDIRGQIRYHKQRGKKILPPNCRSYYQDFGVCFPDSLCDRIKNPVQYSKRKSFMLNKTKAKRMKLTDEQKAMRKEHRENLKKAKITTDEHEA
jgi:hypothetical protein